MLLKIFSHEPKDWKDLQIKVAAILFEIGYECVVEKDIETTREKINVDVYARHKTRKPHVTILCECKHWNNAVPKNVIHAFRTTVNDFGANYGIIISKGGFQRGARKAIKNTNILLFDWSQFQQYFASDWIKGRVDRMSNETSALWNYISAGFYVFFKKEYESLPEQKLAIFNKLNYDYFHFSFNSSKLGYPKLDNGEFDVRMFENFIKEIETLVDRKFTALDEYFDCLLTNCNEGAEKFDNLFGKKLRRQNI